MEKNAVSPTLVGIFVMTTLNASKSTIDSLLQDVIVKTIINKFNIFFIVICLFKHRVCIHTTNQNFASIWDLTLFPMQV